jgi:hypothetical protein
LELEEPTLIKTFSFSIDDPYKPKIIGEGPYNRDNYIVTVPNFKKQSKSFAIEWGTQNNIKISFVTIDSTHSEYRDSYANDEIISQSVPYGYKLADLTKNAEIVLKVIKKSTVTTKINCNLEENSSLSSCILPDMKGWTLNQFNSWINNININIIINKVPIGIDSLSPLYDPALANTIYNQNKDAGTRLIDIAELSIYYFIKVDEVE